MDERKSPEEILARVQEEERTSSLGKLKIFLGMAAGVGKTYTMLEAAQNLKKEGVDLVAGLVVTHGRKETEQLLEGLELIGEKVVQYRDTTLLEFDLDAALKRKPAVILIDELAHTNAPDCRHEKRWQDVEELLEAGISVYTTLNIQHLESVNDMIAQITGITVRETIPDTLFERAYEVELVDLPPDELIQRLREGKVYTGDQSKTALENFFRKGNLIALRELALRATAQRVDAQMQKYRTDEAIRQVWPVAERLLVCVSPSPLAHRLVRAAKRMATGLRTDWIALWIEPTDSSKLRTTEKDLVMQTLHLAESLGGEVVTLSGDNRSEEIIRYAERRNVSKILIGKPARPRWREITFGSVVDDVIRKSGDIDVYVITGEGQGAQPKEKNVRSSSLELRPYLAAVAVVLLTSALLRPFSSHLKPVNAVMLYELAVVLIALRFGKGPSILSVVLSVLAFDFLFVPPYWSLAVLNSQYIITFAVMLLVGLTLSTLTSTVKRQAESARERERRTAALYAMTREQATAFGKEKVVATSVRHISEVFDCQIVVYLVNDTGQLSRVENIQPSFEVDSKEFGVAQWVFINGHVAGTGTSTLPGARALYCPLAGSQGPIGVIGLRPRFPKRLQDPAEMHLLETFVNQMALCVERALLSEKASLGAQADR